MYDHVLCTLYSLKCLLYDMWSCLCKYLYRDIIRYEILLYKCSAELVLSLGRCRKSDLYLLETDPDKLLEKFQLLIKAHRYDQGLITVSQIHAAPDRCFVNILLVYPVCALYRRHVIATLVILIILH